MILRFDSRPCVAPFTVWRALSSATAFGTGLLTAVSFGTVPAELHADEIDGRTLGAAGLLSGGAQELPALTLSVVEPMSDGEPYQLVSGGYYSIDIVCDGSGELAISGSGFFRSVWVDEVVINDIEVRPMGMESLEFDDEGTATLRFIAIKPGSYSLSIPGSSGTSQRAEFIIGGS